MKYRKDWDLTSVPFEAIPEDLLKTWISLRTNAKKGKKQDVDPKTRRRLDQLAAAMKRYRQRQKKQEHSRPN